jgi:hypothetical protein
VDVWLEIYASAMSMGFSDSFRVTEAYKKDGGWWHWQDGEKQLRSEYVTHWMPLPPKPKKTP